MNDEKEIKTYRERIRLYIKKNKRFYTWLFIFLILPLFVECVIYFIEKGLKIEFIQAFKKIFYILREYKSYYATILTLSFAIFSYNKQQEKLLEERQKENELKEKELEAKRDYYRPIFVIETDKHNHSIKKVKLLMKDDSLCLERVNFYSKTTDENLYNRQFKSGDIITTCEGFSFYITAETLIGETILFGYLNDDVKIYKYLKDNGDPTKPYKKDLIPKYKQNEIDSVWGTYNKTINQYNNLDSIFFYSTASIRFWLSYTRGGPFSNGLKKETATLFFRTIFSEMSEVYYYIKNTDYTRHKILKLFIDIFNENIEYIHIDIDEIDKDEFRMFSYSLVSNKIPEELEFKIRTLNDKICNINSFDISEFLQIMGECMDFIEEHLSEEILTDILRLFDTVFSNVELSSAMDVYLPKYKSYILELTFQFGSPEMDFDRMYPF